jgi:Cof subfamily protein (haloacid dehalogenase superfamily)
MGRVKLFIADVDGTLVTHDKALTPRASAAVKALRNDGIAFAITSGRPPRGMAMLIEPLGLSTPVAAFNGGMLVEPDLVTILERRTVPTSPSLEAVDLLLREGLDVWVYRDSDWFVRRIDAPHVARERATVQFEPTVVEDLRAVVDGAVKIVGISDDRERVAKCEEALRQRFTGHIAAARSQPYYLDITHPDANKGTVVRDLSQRLGGVPTQQIATIGDMPNDVLMFSLCGVSIAMGNASPDVQRAARYVTSSNQEEGFANAVDRFVRSSAEPPPSP